jgi:hypothetical protein
MCFSVMKSTKMSPTVSFLITFCWKANYPVLDFIHSGLSDSSLYTFRTYPVAVKVNFNGFVKQQYVVPSVVSSN